MSDTVIRPDLPFRFQPGAPPPIQPGRRRSSWRLFCFGGLALLLLVGIVVATYFYVHISGNRKVAEAIAEVERVDPRWKLDDIEADRVVVPDEVNSANQ